MEPRVSKWNLGQKVGDVFVDNVCSVKLCHANSWKIEKFRLYIPYVTNYKQAITCIEESKKEYPAFGEFLEVCGHLFLLF